MKIPLPFLTIKNAWAYYLLKWGWISKATLRFRTQPDSLSVDLDRHLQRQARRTVKDLCKLIRCGEFEYHQEDHAMVIYSLRKVQQHRAPFNLLRIESIRYFLEHDIAFKDSEEGPLFEIAIKGFRFLARKDIPGDAFVLGETFLDGEYDFLRPYLAGAAVLDIGAYIGDTAVLFAHYGARTIVAFEPHPELYQLAKKNIALNRLESQVILRHEGVAGKDGELRIREDSDAGASAAFGLYESDRGKTIGLRLVSINKIIAELGTIDVLKMDCEGAEFEIFEALPENELKKIKAIGLEYHRDPKLIIAKLENAGFVVKVVPDPESNQGLLFAVLK